jgi:hypothetical protein
MTDQATGVVRAQLSATWLFGTKSAGDLLLPTSPGFFFVQDHNAHSDGATILLSDAVFRADRVRVRD